VAKLDGSAYVVCVPARPADQAWRRVAPLGR
jgi:hypothetical protein